MILFITGIILLSILCLCFFNIKWGTTLFLAYSILVPIWDITLGPIHIGDNFVKTILLLSLLFDLKIKHNYRLSWKLMIPLIVYYLLILIVIPLQDETPLSWMLNSYRVSIMSVLFESFVIYNVLTHYPNTAKLYRYALITSIVIAACYGIFLTTTGGTNPYIISIILTKGTVTEAETMMSYFSAEDRMFGRISSVFLHPMTFGLFIGLSFIYIFSIRASLKKWLFLVLLSLLTLNALFCGVRSCIGGLIIAITAYLLLSKNFKAGFATLIFGVLGYYVISKLPELFGYVSSIVDIHNTKGNVNGSSIEMRLDQLYGCIKEIKRSPILGKGFDWHDYYHSLHGDHPVILAFESLIFIILCDNGFLGFLFWGILIFLLLKNNHSLRVNDIPIIDCLFIYYLSYSCITGEYGYMPYFLLFYICMSFDNKTIIKKHK